MKIKLADSFGFCFGVKRAISMAENSPNSFTLGSLIHNPMEIKRLKDKFNIKQIDNILDVKSNSKVIVRAHGIVKPDLDLLKKRGAFITDSTCPFVTKLQNICHKVTSLGYDLVIFGDENHPEVKGVISYCKKMPTVILHKDELKDISFKSKIIVVSQTTKNQDSFFEIIEYLKSKYSDVEFHNTICNATFENQKAAKDIAKESDVAIVIGGKNSSNTKQLLNILKNYCKDSYLIENSEELKTDWFRGKRLCGVTAGASTPNWVIKDVIKKIDYLDKELNRENQTRQRA